MTWMTWTYIKKAGGWGGKLSCDWFSWQGQVRVSLERNLHMSYNPLFDVKHKGNISSYSQQIKFRILSISEMKSFTDLLLSNRFSILDKNMCSVLSHSEDPVTLAAVHTIVQSTSASNSEKTNMNLQFLNCKLKLSFDICRKWVTLNALFRY